MSDCQGSSSKLKWLERISKPYVPYRAEIYSYRRVGTYVRLLWLIECHLRWAYQARHSWKFRMHCSPLNRKRQFSKQQVGNMASSVTHRISVKEQVKGWHIIIKNVHINSVGFQSSQIRFRFTVYLFISCLFPRFSSASCSGVVGVLTKLWCVATSVYF